jgi:hypothetical protein
MFSSKNRRIDNRKDILDFRSLLVGVETNQGFCGFMPD